MPATTKKKNPQDATLRNIRAQKARTSRLEEQVAHNHLVTLEALTKLTETVNNLTATMEILVKKGA